MGGVRGRWKWCIQASAGRTVAVVEDRNTSLERAIGGRKRVSRIALGSRVDDEPSTCSVVSGARSNVTPLAVAIVSVGCPRLCVRPARHTHHRPIVASKELPWSKPQGAGCQGWRRRRQWWRSRRSGTLGTERALARAPAALRGPVLGVSGAEGLTRPARSIDRSWHERRPSPSEVQSATTGNVPSKIGVSPAAAAIVTPRKLVSTSSVA
eukprot:7388252-Prymnesium_polylepis.1